MLDAVSKLDRLARSLPDARDIAENLTGREVRLNLGGSIYDPTDPVGRLLFNVLAMVAAFEADLIRTARRPEHDRTSRARAYGRIEFGFSSHAAIWGLAARFRPMRP